MSKHLNEPKLALPKLISITTKVSGQPGRFWLGYPLFISPPHPEYRQLIVTNRL